MLFLLLLFFAGFQHIKGLWTHLDVFVTEKNGFEPGKGKLGDSFVILPNEGQGLFIHLEALQKSGVKHKPAKNRGIGGGHVKKLGDRYGGAGGIPR